MRGEEGRKKPVQARKKKEADKAIKDHPRVSCGGKDVWLKHMRNFDTGESPPQLSYAGKGEKAVWKDIKQAEAGNHPRVMRGKMGNEKRVLASFRDHPRVCGEKAYNRGNERVAMRITPAYAGKKPQGTRDYFV